MAMYYYASKLSSIACRSRCKRTTSTSNLLLNDTEQRNKNPNLKRITNETNSIDDNVTTLTTITTRLESTDINLACDDVENNGIPMSPVDYGLPSGPLESFIGRLITDQNDDYNEDFIFSFLLVSRMFIKPHELFGKLIQAVPEQQSLERLIQLLAIWTKKFPYDFREDHIMGHVKHIATRCVNTDLGDLVSDQLSALLKRLTQLEQHEEDLRACQVISSEKIDTIKWSSSSHLAQILCNVERKLAKHVGPEEFIQCADNVLIERTKRKQEKLDSCDVITGPPGVQDPKKTCNLESYLDWSSRLRLLVINEILLCNGINERSKTIEFWIDVAQYCLLVGNYNSTTIILDSLDTPAIVRLHKTWNKLAATTTSQQLNCMQKHTDGYENLWTQQTKNSSIYNVPRKVQLRTPTNEPMKVKQQQTTIPLSNRQTTTTTTPITTTEWVVIPVFEDIVRLALLARSECIKLLPNNNVNIGAFMKLGTIVHAFTKHMSQVNTIVGIKDNEEYQQIFQKMHNCVLHTDRDMILASFDCEEPNEEEKQNYGVL